MPRQGIGYIFGKKKGALRLGLKALMDGGSTLLKRRGTNLDLTFERFRLMDTATPAIRQYGNHMIGKLPLTT